MTRQYSALSLFSGAGGMDIGVKQAGFQALACVESDPHCCDTLRAAATRDKAATVVMEEDIRKLDPVALMRELGLEPGELDLLCGGPPCQAFSQIGKRGCLDDERGALLFEMIRFAEVFRPHAVLIEQVKGLLNAPDAEGRVGGVLERLLRNLEELEYVPKWKTILAADYGVPQMRERVFIVAMRPPNAFAFPAPTHSRNNRDIAPFPLPSYVSAGEAFVGLGAPPEGNCADDSHIDVTPLGDRRRIRGVPEGSHLAKESHLPPEQRGALSKKDTTKFRRLSRSAPSLTLRCGEIFFHPLEDRYLTPREAMRLHGFPDDYELKGPIRGRCGRVKNLDRHRQVANSVPPPVARALAEAIRNALPASQPSAESPHQKGRTP